MLSVVIPALNEEKNIAQLLESLRAQTFKDLEVIVADAGSNDQTAKIAEGYGARVVRGGMISVGRNAGAKVAKGDLIFFFDADVVLPPNFIEKTLEKFKEKNLDVASCFFTPISEKKIDWLLHEVVNVFFQATQKFLPHAAGFCLLVKKKIHKKIGGFDESVVHAEDIDYVRRAAKVGKFGIITDPRIRVSVRRLEKDGRLNVALKYLIAEAYINLIGDIRNNFLNYNFAHYNKSEKEKLMEKLREKVLSSARERFVVSKKYLTEIYAELISSVKKVR